MLLDLREIIGVPGSRVRFEYEPDLSGAAFGSVVQIEKPARAAGSVVNSAGVLTFLADVDAKCVVCCARCLKEFRLPVSTRISALLIESSEDSGEDSDGYLLQGDKIDADEIIITEFVLELDQRLLCRPDCAGLCQKCGSDLNDGPCSCKADTDPRLAALASLLDNDEEVFTDGSSKE